MYSLERRIEETAPVLVAAGIVIANIVAVLGLWHPSGTALATINAVGAAVLAFLIQGVPGLQSWQVRRRYRAAARYEARDLVPTAGSVLDEVVGRDDLCQVLMAALAGRRVRPHVLVGGVGTGKTSVLVRLTESLADKRAIPVPIRLRDAVYALDFENLAQERFLDEVNPYLLSSDEGEKVWRRLRRDGRIVVLADGLEEALVGSNAERDRDNIIRAAIRRAHQQRLPLVITSRPHDPLRATDATILALEPLSYPAALAFIGSDGTSEDQRRLAWMAETAGLMEAPLYLQIARQLQVTGLLEPASPGREALVDTVHADRSKLRVGLLQTWERALVQGHLHEEVPLNRAERQATVELLSAVACVGLKFDRLVVDFDDPTGQQVSAELQRRLARLDAEWGQAPGVRNIDVRLAAAWAAQLELVELRGSSVRFPHSVMQAYLGSRLLDAALLDPDYCRRALRPPGPGREFLTALVLHSRASTHQETEKMSRGESRIAAGKARSPGPEAPGRVQAEPVRLLRQAAASRDDSKVLEMYGAAIEIDSVAADPAHTAIAEEIAGRWSRIHANDPRTLEQGKLGLVRQFGEAMRTIDERRHRQSCSAEPAYRQLYEIGCRERSYPIQLAAAHEIGAGGVSAYEALRHVLAAPCRKCKAERDGQKPAKSSKSGAQFRYTSDDREWRAETLSAWIAPMLVGSVGVTGSSRADKILAEQARADLQRWLRHVRPDGRRPGEEDLPLSLEIALAQGFKYAANRRPAYSDALWETRRYLAGQALEMLKGTRFWFTQLTLIQALGLLNLPDFSQPPANRHGAPPEAVVQHWLDVAGRETAERGRRLGAPAFHPFVVEAAQLAVLALKTGIPERYCWIDESGVIQQLGSRDASIPMEYHNQRLWIPPSAGWTALSSRAQQLVADVLLLLNLAERGEEPRDREQRLTQSNREDLPPCITHFRSALDPGRTVGTAMPSAPGMNCVQGCVFELCPYPPKGTQPGREMSEAFCRHQQTLLSRNSVASKKAPWQEMRRSQLAYFWAQMADRADGPRPRTLRLRAPRPRAPRRGSERLRVPRLRARPGSR
jgi:hypothetical protein